MTRDQMLAWLREDDASRLERLWRQADDCRRRHVGDAVHLRGLVEFSNVCRRQCLYCGLRAGNASLTRYRMTEAEILDCAARAGSLGYGTVVLQSGEDPGIETEWLAGIVRRIKATTPLAVTLSVGERTEAELAAWRDAGADRYLLRFETSDAALYRGIHPPARTDPLSRTTEGRREDARESCPRHTTPAVAQTGPGDRIAQLATLRRLGYQVGSGVMIGIPAQSYDSLADDIALFAELDLDMIGVGPFLPHPQTPLGGMRISDCGLRIEEDSDTQSQIRNPKSEIRNGSQGQAPNAERMTYKVVALARLACPDANVPSTTALATVDPQRGLELGLARGANVVMPNLTPAKYRTLYEIYPAKASARESAGEFDAALRARIGSIGRSVATGRGDRRRTI